MKTNYIFTSVLILTVVSLFSSCQSGSEKVQIAHENVRVANNAVALAQINLNHTIRDTLTDFEQSRKDSELRILSNEKRIFEFKSKRIAQKEKNVEKYEMELARLIKTNNTLKLQASK